VRPALEAFLVSRLQTLLKLNRIDLPSKPEAQSPAEGLKEFEIQVAPDANARSGAFKVGTRDELVIALVLTVQRPPRPGIEYARMPGIGFQETGGRR